MRNMHKYEELTPYEFNCEKERASIIYVAAGPMEYHEECNVLGIDPLKGYQWCLEAAEITGGIVFPILPIAPDGPPPFLNRAELKEQIAMVKFGEYTREPMLYPSVMISREVCRALYLELLETFADELKFKLCVFIGSHGPAGQMIKQIVAEESDSGDFHGMRVMTVASLDYNLDIIREFHAEQKIERINHGGVWETALNYALNPDYFQPQYLDAEKYPQHYGALAETHFEGCVRPTRSEYRKFSPEFARKIYETTVQRFARDVLDRLKELK